MFTWQSSICLWNPIERCFSWLGSISRLLFWYIRYPLASRSHAFSIRTREKTWCFAIHPIAGSPSRPIRLQDIAMWCKSPMLFGLLHRTWLVRALFLLFLTQILYSAQVFPQYIKSAPGWRNPSHRQSGIGSARRALAVLRLHVTLYS